MTESPRYLVIQLDQSDPAPVAVSDAALARVFLSDPQAIATFWSDVTFGHIDLTGAVVMPRAAYPGPLSEGAGAQLVGHVVNGIRAGAERDPLEGFDGAFVLINPGQFDYPNPAFDPANPMANPPTVRRSLRAFRGSLADGRPCAVMPAGTVDFFTMYHEVGHMLGFAHPRGLVNAGVNDAATAVVETSTEYGSPYDIMGMGPQTDPAHAPGWWRSGSTFTGVAVAGWAPLVQGRVGPALSRAQLHLRSPEALAGRVTERALPAGGGTESVSAPVREGRLVVLRSSSDATNPSLRTYVEYRSAKGWDAGLAPDPGAIEGEGVAVHLVRYDGTRWRIDYAGAVTRNSADHDVAIWGTGMTLTVDEWVEGGANIRVAVHDNVRAVQLAAVVEGGALGDPIGEIERVRTACGTFYRKGEWETSTHVVVEARVVGFGASGEFSGPPPTLVWAVDGVEVRPSSGSLPTPGGARLPYSFDAWRRALVMDSAPGVSASLTISAWVAGDTIHKGEAVVTIDGSYSGIHPDDWGIQLDCIQRSIPINVDWMELPKKPIPLEFGQIDWQLERERATWIARQQGLVEDLTELRTADLTGLRDLVTARVDALPTDLPLSRLRIDRLRGPR